MESKKRTQEAITAFVRNWVKQRNDAGESTTEIAKSLGFASHASIVQYLTPGFPVKVTANAQEHVAAILFKGSMDRLRDEALAWYATQRRDLPSVYEQAIGYLLHQHGRDFYQAALVHFEEAAHGGNVGLAPQELAAQIYEIAQREKGKSIAGSELSDKDAGDGMGGAKALGRRKRK